MHVVIQAPDIAVVVVLALGCLVGRKHLNAIVVSRAVLALGCIAVAVVGLALGCLVVSALEWLLVE